MPAYRIDTTPSALRLYEPSRQRLQRNLLVTVLWMGLPAIGFFVAFFDHNPSAMHLWAVIALIFLVLSIPDWLRWQTLEVDRQHRLLILRKTRVGRWGLRESRLPLHQVGKIQVVPFSGRLGEYWSPPEARLKIFTAGGGRWATFRFYSVPAAEEARRRLLQALEMTA